MFYPSSLMRLLTSSLFFHEYSFLLHLEYLMVCEARQLPSNMFSLVPCFLSLRPAGPDSSSTLLWDLRLHWRSRQRCTPKGYHHCPHRELQVCGKSVSLSDLFLFGGGSSVVAWGKYCWFSISQTVLFRIVPTSRWPSCWQTRWPVYGADVSAGLCGSSTNWMPSCTGIWLRPLEDRP